MGRLLFLLVACVLFCDGSDRDYVKVAERYSSENSTQIDAHLNEWRLVGSVGIDDTLTALAITFSSEIGLDQSTVFCRAIWEDKKTGDYKCTAPWIGNFYLIKKSNLLFISIDRVLKDSVGIK